MKRLIAVLAALPLAAFAQGAGPAAPAGNAPAGPGPGPGGGMRGWAAQRPTPEQLQQMQKRARLALTLGLSVALDLDDAQALKLGQTVSKFAERRRAVHEQLRDAHQTLRRAAHGEKVAASDVDQAIARSLDGRAQLQAIDRELVTAVTQGLTPEKKARAVLFLARFERRFGHGGGPGMMRGRGMMQHGPGMGPGAGPGMMRGGPGGPGMRGGMGMGPGQDDGAMASCAGGDCDWDELED